MNNIKPSERIKQIYKKMEDDCVFPTWITPSNIKSIIDYLDEQWENKKCCVGGCDNIKCANYKVTASSTADTNVSNSGGK